MILYHGSDKIIPKPLYGFGKEDNDYGSGFYLCEDIEKANAWAVNNGSDRAICNQYNFPVEDMNVLYLDECGTLAWIAEVVSHRGVSDEDTEYAAKLFAAEYKINTDDYDVIIGYRADDSYMRVIDAFFKGQLNIAEVDRFFREGELGNQVFIKSSKAFDAIKFLKSTEVKDRNKYINYDAQARRKAANFLDNRRRQIVQDNYQPHGVTLKEVLSQKYAYDSSLKYYFPESIINRPYKPQSREDNTHER
ncbi:MAG: DUF3990 domain-containing protein [Lachnospiraceae bacterium]|nr:DUF3990 domain-containing protein [Lachnospiraceae bacterium]